MKYLFAILLFLISLQYTVAQDKPDGPYKDYYDSGELKIEGQYKNQKRVGEWKRFHKNGQVSNLYSYNNGKQNKEEISYFENGVISNKTELENGKYVHFGYYESGNLKYKRQDQSGYFISYYESGEKEIEANYLDYDLVGEWKRYYENGQIEWLVNYEEGYRQLGYKHFYENGDLKLEGNNFKDKLYGEEKRYLPNNVLEWKGDYNQGLFVKTWTKFDANGHKIEKIKFNKGKAKNAELANILTPTKVPEGVTERVPIFPGCEEMLTNKTRKKCMNTNVAQYIANNFNTNLAVKSNIKGRQKIYVIFKINKEGNIFDIKARNQHNILRLEATRIISTLPKFEPGYQKGEPVIVPFSIPIVFNVQ